MRNTDTTQLAQQVVDKAIAAHGGAAYERLDVQFSFRGQCFSVHRNDGAFAYYRKTVDNNGNSIVDTLTNEGFIHFNAAQVPDSIRQKSRNAAYSTTNSVVYFALLPYGLNDPAVVKEYLGEVALQGKQYHKVQVTFLQENGGDDYEDRFVYWFDKDDCSMDYMAYAYHTNGGGLRLRVATGREEVAGVMWQQYDNYEAPTGISVVALDSLFECGELKKLSEIRLDNLAPTHHTGNSCL
jgi:hypothetical protein